MTQERFGEICGTVARIVVPLLNRLAWGIAGGDVAVSAGKSHFDGFVCGFAIASIGYLIHAELRAMRRVG